MGLTFSSSHLQVACPSSRFRDEETAAAAEVIRSGWLKMGAKTFQFEEELHVLSAYRMRLPFFWYHGTALGTVLIPTSALTSHRRGVSSPRTDTLFPDRPYLVATFSSHRKIQK